MGDRREAGGGSWHFALDCRSGTTVCCRVVAVSEQGQGRFSTHAIILTPCAETKKELADVVPAHTPGVPVSVPVTAPSEPVGVASTRAPGVPAVIRHTCLVPSQKAYGKHKHPFPKMQVPVIARLLQADF